MSFGPHDLARTTKVIDGPATCRFHAGGVTAHRYISEEAATVPQRIALPPEAADAGQWGERDDRRA